MLGQRANPATLRTMVEIILGQRANPATLRNETAFLCSLVVVALEERHSKDKTAGAKCAKAKCAVVVAKWPWRGRRWDRLRLSFFRKPEPRGVVYF